MLNNEKCAGGPFMVLDDKEGSYSPQMLNATEYWNYGAEEWCNLEGQYVFIEANLEHLSGQQYEMTICSLGVMGVEYIRDVQLPTYIELTQ